VVAPGRSLAFDLYRPPGNPAPLTEFVRLWSMGAWWGITSRSNGQRFLSPQNKVAGGGNLYKILWTGRDSLASTRRDQYASGA